MSALRNALHAALNRPRLLALAAAVVVCETAVRVALGWIVAPALALLWPPVIAVVALGAGAPVVREALPSGPADPSPSSLLALAAAAVVGHAVALVGGTAAFLLVDTPLRAALYAAGVDSSTVRVVLRAVVGVSLGTALAWAVPATGVVRLVAGADPRRAARTALVRPFRSLRGLATAVGLHLVAAGAVVGVVALGFAVAGPRSPALGVALAGGLVALVAPFGLAALAAFHLDRDATGRGGPVGDPVRVALAALLLSGLVVGAGAVRVAELRPLDAAPAALPDDPDGTYATALDNTRRADHRHRAAVDPGPEAFVIEHRIDRSDRQYRQIPSGEAAGPAVYASSGTGSPPIRGLGSVALGTRTLGDGRTVRASPDYLRWAAAYDRERTGGLQPPSPAVDGWTVVDRGDDRIVLELRDPRSVFAATHGTDPDRIANVSRARIRATIDPDRRTVDRIEVRFAATVVDDGRSDRVAAHVVHEFAAADVTRPAAVGDPAPGEAVWKLLVY